MAKLNLSMIDEYYEMMNDTNKECEGFIYDFLKEHDNCMITYNVKTQCNVGGEVVRVYNYEEYRYSDVEGLFIDENDDKVYLELEDCEKYDMANCSNEEIINIAIYLNDNAEEFDEII